MLTYQIEQAYLTSELTSFRDLLVSKSEKKN